MSVDKDFAGLVWPLLQGYYQYFICALLLAIGGPVLRSTRKQRYIPDIPIVGIEEPGGITQARQNFCKDAKSILADGYQMACRRSTSMVCLRLNKEQYKNQSPFYVPSRLGERLMIPTRYVEELKNAPVNEVNLVATFLETFAAKYTALDVRSTLHPRVASRDLSRHLDDIHIPVKDEVIKSFEECLPECKDWTRLCMSDSFTTIVARASSQLFGGSQLSSNNEWVQATINFSKDVFIGSQRIKKIPSMLRPVAQYFIPELRRIAEYHTVARRIIIPILENREAQSEKPSDFLQWMSNSAVGPEKEKMFLASTLLKLSFAAIHKGAAAPTQLLYDLCAMPQYMEPLREEIRMTLAEHGSFTSGALHQMELMDSFIRESQRFNPHLLVTFERLITKDYVLSDGFVIPKGTIIGVPTQAISMDPDVYEKPEVFDGFRFIELKNNSSIDEARLQYTSSDLNNMAFGYGRHACPGRFFASSETKMIMAYMLMHYDFRFPDEQKIRPPSLTYETQYLPDLTTTILVKRRPSPCQTAFTT